MTQIRVLRLLEYTYPDVEHMELDMARWAVQQGSIRFGSNPTVIKSVVLPLEVLAVPLAVPEEEPGKNPLIPGYCDASCAVSLEGGDHWCTPLQAVADLAAKLEALDV